MLLTNVCMKGIAMKEFWNNMVTLSGWTIAIGFITAFSIFINLDAYNTFGQAMVQYGLGVFIAVIGIVFFNISLMKRDNVTHKELVARNRRNLINSFANFGHMDSNNKDRK